MPAHDGLGLDDDQDLPAARPELAQQDPGGAIQRCELGPPPSIGEDRELLACGILWSGATLTRLEVPAVRWRVEARSRGAKTD